MLKCYFDGHRQEESFVLFIDNKNDIKPSESNVWIPAIAINCFTQKVKMLNLKDIFQCPKLAYGWNIYHSAHAARTASVNID